MTAAGERAFCLADWSRALFVHYAVEPAVLQPHVPFALDLFGGKAYVSLVAFAQKNVRPLFTAAFGRLARRVAARCAKPVAEHAFLNLRTYVRHHGEPAIYFLAEWIDNRIDRVVGPATYGLPYRLAKLRYDYDGTGRPLAGEVTDGRDSFAFEATVNRAARFAPAAPGLDSFLLERYTAFTRRGTTCRRFRIAHAPWPQARATVTARATSLLDRAAPWFAACRYAGANFSPGVNDVRIGPPCKVRPAPLPEPARSGPSWTAAGLTLLGSIPVAALSVGAPRWALMWAIALALLFTCKCIALRRAAPLGDAMRRLAYFFAWVAMDAPAFLTSRLLKLRPRAASGGAL
jgi:uncharacterized protein YqjF (DUF2071 family)